MGLCPMCEKIKALRIKQGRGYRIDLCPQCQKIDLYQRLKTVKKRKLSLV